MRVLFVVPYIPSLIRVRPYQLIRHLAPSHAITLLASAASDAATDIAALQAVCERVELFPTTLPSRLRTGARAMLTGRPLQAAISQSPALTRRARQLLDREPFDVVHIEHLRAADLGFALPASTPVVYDAVDCISLLLQRTLASSHCRRQRLLAAVDLQRTRRYEARLMRQFHAVAVTSDDDRAALLHLAPAAPVSVVPNGVDLDHFQPGDGQREPATLVFSGKMSYHANVSAVLHLVERILPLVRRHRPDVRVRIVGSQPPAGVVALARDPAIEVTGYLPDIRPALATATIGICPMTVKVGIQNKALEAMAMGLPVVTTRAGFSGLAATPGRDLLVADTPAEFATHVCRLLDDHDARAAVAQAGRQYVQAHHRWGSAAQQFDHLYQQAIVSQPTQHARTDVAQTAWRTG